MDVAAAIPPAVGLVLAAADGVVVVWHVDVHVHCKQLIDDVADSLLGKGYGDLPFVPSPRRLRATRPSLY